MASQRKRDSPAGSDRSLPKGIAKGAARLGQKPTSARLQVDVNGAVKGILKNNDFAKAFLAIWLGDDPPNSAIPAGVLGGACGRSWRAPRLLIRVDASHPPNLGDRLLASEAVGQSTLTLSIGQTAVSAHQPGRTAVASSSIFPGLSSRSDTKIMLIAG